MVRTTTARTAIVLVLVAVVAGCTPRDYAVSACRDPERPVLVVPSNHTVPWPAPALIIPNDTTIEASAGDWVHDNPSSTGHRVGVKFHRPDVANSQRVRLCFIGGTLRTTLHPETTSWDVWHDTYAFIQENPSPVVVGIRLFNTGDGITFTHRANGWLVVGVRTDGMGAFAGGYVHDDCVENDSMFAGAIVDSKFDGCHVFLSADAGEILENPPDGTGRQIIVEQTLVRLQPYEQSFNPSKYGTNRHGGFFKFSPYPSTGTPPQLVVRNSTFRSDEPASYGGNANGKLGLPPGSICENVMLIGTETWPDAEVQSWVDQCTGLTFGTIGDWQVRVGHWDDTHPDP